MVVLPATGVHILLFVFAETCTQLLIHVTAQKTDTLTRPTAKTAEDVKPVVTSSERMSSLFTVFLVRGAERNLSRGFHAGPDHTTGFGVYHWQSSMSASN